MKRHPFDFDVAIAGAGPGGTMAALRLAEAGFSVGLFDSLEERGLGRSLVLETEPTVYSRVGLPFPSGDMVAYEIERMRFISPRGRELFIFEERDHALPVAINLDVLVKELLTQAKKAGVRFFPGTRVDGPLAEGNRVTGLTCRSKARGVRRVTARLTMDATGFSAALVRSLPASFGFDFPESSRHEVSAVNRMHRLVPNAVEGALGAGLFSPEEILARMGVAGSYSTVYSFLSKKTGLAYLLVGVKRDYEGVQSARQVADSFTEKAGCFGKKIRAAAAHIRIRHSLDRLAADGFMVIGEAACTVFPMHGSGVASALITGSMAAETAARALRDNDTSTAGLWPYAAAYQRDRGRRLAAYDVTRLTIDSFSRGDTAALLEDGLMRAEDILNGLQVNEPVISRGSVPGRILAMARNPRFIVPITRMGATIGKVLTHYARYPERYDPVKFAAWKEKKRKIFGRLLDDK